MPKAIVLAVDPLRELFAATTESGDCRVFWVISGPTIQAGDMLESIGICSSECEFRHPDGLCYASGETGPIAQAEALRLVRARN